MKTLVSSREVILKRPFTDVYDAAYVVKEYEVTEYGVKTVDYDFHISYFTPYKSKAEAEAACAKQEAWARQIGDNKYLYVTTRNTFVIRHFDIDMNKREARAKLKESSFKGIDSSEKNSNINIVKVLYSDIDEFVDVDFSFDGEF